MKNPNGTCDFTATEQRAKEMTTIELVMALADLRLSYRSADEMDRKMGGDRGGYYRDVASVYARELFKRSQPKGGAR